MDSTQEKPNTNLLQKLYKQLRIRMFTHSYVFIANVYH